MKLGFPNLNYKTLRGVCSTRPEALAKKYGLTTYHTAGGDYWYKDNGSDILAVAHLDSVVPFLHFSVAKLRPDSLIYCPTLDDRLGAYLILEWLQIAGCRYDILLTENEEKSASTATWFNPPKNKKYNWMFMFDRSGTDVATYEYGDTITHNILVKHDFKPIYGSYSCIRDLQDLGCKGFNFGTAYYNNHSQYAYASKNELLLNLRKFLGFYSEYRDVEMPHEAKYSAASSGNKYVDYYGSHHHSTYPPLVIAKRAYVPVKPLSDGEKVAFAGLFINDVALLPITNDQIFWLYNNGMFVVGQLVRETFSSLARMARVTMGHLDSLVLLKGLRAGLKHISENLNFGMLIEDFDVTDRDLTKAADRLKSRPDRLAESIDPPWKEDFEPCDVSPGEVETIVSRALTVQNFKGSISKEYLELKKVTEDKGDNQKAAVVIHHLPMTDKSLKQFKDKVTENGKSVKMQDRCIRCNEWFEVEITPTSSSLVCPKCESQKKNLVSDVSEAEFTVLEEERVDIGREAERIMGSEDNPQYNLFDDVEETPKEVKLEETGKVFDKMYEEAKDKAQEGLEHLRVNLSKIREMKPDKNASAYEKGWIRIFGNKETKPETVNTPVIQKGRIFTTVMLKRDETYEDEKLIVTKGGAVWKTILPMGFDVTLRAATRAAA